MQGLRLLAEPPAGQSPAPAAARALDHRVYPSK